MGRNESDDERHGQKPDGMGLSSEHEQGQVQEVDERDTEEALAVDALPDEVRLHGDGDETGMDQSTTGSPTPDKPQD